MGVLGGMVKCQPFMGVHSSPLIRKRASIIICFTTPVFETLQLSCKIPLFEAAVAILFIPGAELILLFHFFPYTC